MLDAVMHTPGIKINSTTSLYAVFTGSFTLPNF